jgi:mono/diheme cytochrome c family protein
LIAAVRRRTQSRENLWDLKKEKTLKHAVRLFGVASVAAATLLAGCHHLPPSKPLSELTPTETRGYTVFQQQCAQCHNPNSEQPLHGPGLQGTFKKPYLPSGAPANDDRVRATILDGRNMMPAYANVLDDQQINDLLAYLHTL